MKSNIIAIAVAALALAVFATPDTDAKAWGSWHGMNLRLAGSSYSVTTLPDGTATAVPPFTATQSGIAQGKYGRAAQGAWRRACGAPGENRAQEAWRRIQR